MKEIRGQYQNVPWPLTASAALQGGIQEALDRLSAVLDEQEKLIASLTDKLKALTMPLPEKPLVTEDPPKCRSAVGEAIVYERVRVWRHNEMLQVLLNTLDL